jgi:hypothetical protein
MRLIRVHVVDATTSCESEPYCPQGAVRGQAQCDWKQTYFRLSSSSSAASFQAVAAPSTDDRATA